MIKRTLLATLLVTLTHTTHASGWLEPDNVALRRDIQLLSDYGLLKIPTTSWPQRWGNIQQSLAPLPADAQPLVQAAYLRLDNALKQWQQRQERTATTITTAMGKNQMLLQGFGPAQRSENSAAIAFATAVGPVEGQLSYSAATTTAPRFHPFDHSYFGANLGNWNVGIDQLDRWWGPGWDSSLIFSNNAQPLPTLSFQRNHTKPFDTRLLSWLGPWDLNVRFGQLEEERAIPRGQLFAMRAVFQPLDGVELGLSRAAQWGGKGRANDIGTFFNMFFGKDNSGDNINKDEEPGNQLGGYDIRWSLTSIRTALYTQVIGEDESVMLPTAKLMQYGLEHWGELYSNSYTLFIEYADTTAYRGFHFDAPEFNTAYNNHIFTGGYRYYADSLGHSADSDSIIRSIGLSTVNRQGWGSQMIYRNGTVNRDDAGLNPVYNNKKLQLHEWFVKIDKRGEQYGVSLQLGNSRRESCDGTLNENSVSSAIRIDL